MKVTNFQIKCGANPMHLFFVGKFVIFISKIVLASPISEEPQLRRLLFKVSGSAPNGQTTPVKGCPRKRLNHYVHYILH